LSVQGYLTVSALTKYIKRKFDRDPHLQEVYIKGEISNLKIHSSGHMYFTLKDDKARLLAVMFNHNNLSLSFQPENGMKVLVKGAISVYEQSGQYQIYVKEMSQDGLGDLFVRFEELKNKLLKEGLFSPEYKKPLPQYPKTIGIVTSPTGAAIRDILITLKRRYPIGNVLLFPALVQGANAPASISRAIEKANSYDLDVLIVGRGGGSIEELWAFNEEEVARAIFASTIPIISAVGHETDTTIADFVADVRAATPTAAAELAAPSRDELKRKIVMIQTRLSRAIVTKVSQKEALLERLEKSYAFRYPQKLYEQKIEQLDRTFESLHKSGIRYFMKKMDHYKSLVSVLQKHHPQNRMEQMRSELQRQYRGLNRSLLNILKLKEKEFSGINGKLLMLNPLQIMERGYSVVFDDEENLIKSQEQVKIGDEIEVVLKDGRLRCEVKNKKENEWNE
jgi:exodeoxyribonuclease VII large subunit